MPRIGKTEEDWNGLKLGFWKLFSLTVFQSWSLLPATSKIMLRRHICLSRISDFVIYVHSDRGRVIGKIKQNELDCRDTAHLIVIDWKSTCFFLNQSGASKTKSIVANVIYSLWGLIGSFDWPEDELGFRINDSVKNNAVVLIRWQVLLPQCKSKVFVHDGACTYVRILRKTHLSIVTRFTSRQQSK